MSDSQVEWKWSRFWSIIKEHENEPDSPLVTEAIKKIFTKNFTDWFSSLHYTVQAEVLENAPIDIIAALMPILAPQAVKLITRLMSAPDKRKLGL